MSPPLLPRSSVRGLGRNVDHHWIRFSDLSVSLSDPEWPASQSPVPLGDGVLLRSSSWGSVLMRTLADTW